MIQGQNVDIYAQIFDIMLRNMEKGGLEFPYSKESFLYLLEYNGIDVDVFELFGNRDDIFLEKLFLSILHRLPEEKVRESFVQKETEQGEKRQKAMFYSVVNSVEALNHTVILHHNLWEKDQLEAVKADKKTWLLKKIYLLVRKLPAPVKRIIKWLADKWGILS